MFDLILKNAKIVTKTAILDGDIGILRGKIVKTGKVAEKAHAVKNCENLFILPGVIDMHVHFRDPGFHKKEDFASGSGAAAAGGVTTVVDMPNTNPPTVTCEALDEKRKIAQEKSMVNFGFYMGFTGMNIDEIKKAQNIAGIKVYLSGATGNLLLHDIHLIEKLFELKKVIVIHAENEVIIRENIQKYKESADPSVHSVIRNPHAAGEAVKTMLHFAKKYEARVHITHVSTAGEVEELKKFHSPRISADATPHHLYLTQSAYSERANYVKVNPPLRTNKDRNALWKALYEGFIQAVASDHAPHTKAEKEKTYSEAPAGVPGVETLLPLLLDSVNHGELHLRQVAQITSENPAKILGISEKGKIEAGYDADLVIVDMNKEFEVGSKGFFTKCGWSPFSGWKLKGWPVITIVNGAVAYENGKLVGKSRGAEVKFNA